MLLSQVVKQMMASVMPVLRYALDAAAAEAPAQGLDAIVSALTHRVEHLRPLMDPRVLRRAAKDLWNSCAGVRSTHILAPLEISERLCRSEAWQGWRTVLCAVLAHQNSPASRSLP